MRLGRLLLSGAATASLGRALFWLSQPGAGREAATRLSALTRALHELPNKPLRWPLHDASAGLRRRSVRGGYVILYRVHDAHPDFPSGECVVEVVDLVGPRQELGKARRPTDS